MLYLFADCILDVGRRELRRGSEPVAVEPQVFDLLVYLIENRDRVVGKDDLIASVWRGRIVSDSTLTSRIHAARKAIGDGADRQVLIRTVPRKGLRFVADVREGPEPEIKGDPPPGPTRIEPAPAAAEADPDRAPSAARRASVAVMPFVDLAAGRVPGGPGDALVHDVITRLAKLRSLFVIAQGTVFALRDRGVGPMEAGQVLAVDYVASGSVRRAAGRLVVEVELAETRTARIVWAERFDRPLDDAFLILGEIGDCIVASIATEIETLERNRAVLKPPNSLDAWEAYHRGLWHMYRFTKADNTEAMRFFLMALRLDPTFARAHAGMSFTHWQNAFQGWAEREPEIERAYAAAAQSLLVDDRDPAAHLAMGRALWLRGASERSVGELDHAVELSPNFALGHYNLAFVNATVGDPLAAIHSADFSRRLSPFDPMLFGMLGARAMALIRLGRFEEAAAWGAKAAARPNAHAHILAIAACASALAERPEEARAHAGTLVRASPGYTADHFVGAMNFPPDVGRLFRDGARRAGLP